MKTKFLSTPWMTNFDHPLFNHFNSFLDFFTDDSYACFFIYHQIFMENGAKHFMLSFQRLPILKVVQN